MVKCLCRDKEKKAALAPGPSVFMAQSQCERKDGPCTHLVVDCVLLSDWPVVWDSLCGIMSDLLLPETQRTEGLHNPVGAL